MKGVSEDDIELAPLGLMNPMGKEHCLIAVDHFIAIGAEDAAAQALAEARPKLADAPGAFKVSLVLADDRMGGWTSRTFSGFGMRYLTKDAKKALEKRPFITVPCWTSDVDSWTTDDARRATLAQVYRVAHIMQHGDPKMLREMMRQEAEALAFAGETTITLPDDDLAYAREVIASHLDAADQPTVFACLFGDEAASEAGYPQATRNSACPRRRRLKWRCGCPRNPASPETLAAVAAVALGSVPGMPVKPDVT